MIHKDMKLTLEEAKLEDPWKFDDKGKLREGHKAAKFPDGLEISLGNVALKKLGLSAKDFKTSQKLTVEANVIVERVKDEQVLGDDPEMMVTLQITGMDIQHNSDHASGDLKDQLFTSMK